MNSIKIYEVKKIKIPNPQNIPGAIKAVYEGKRFESYVGWSFAKSLKAENYLKGVKYDFSTERKRLHEIINLLYKDTKILNEEIRKVESKINDFMENSQELLKYYPRESSTSVSSSTKDNETNKSKSNKEIKGDFDIIIPNVKKENFLEMLEKNFYSKKADKCIIYDQNKINKLPQYFNLFIEVGMSSFLDSYRHKTQQIKKYMSIINFGDNIIDNEQIRSYYKKDFQKRFSLHLNADSHEIADTFVYMLVSNSYYGEFTTRFLDNRNGLKLDDNSELNSIVPKDSKEVLLCGFVDFPKILNCYREYESIKKIDEKLKKMDSMQKELDNLKWIVNKTMNNNNLGHYNIIDNINNNNNYYSQFNDYNNSNNYYFGHNNYNYDYNDYYSFNYNHDFGYNNYFYYNSYHY